MIAGHEAPCLQRGADGPGVVVDLAPAHLLRNVVGGHRRSDERDSRAGVGGELEPLDGGQRLVVAHQHDASRRTRRSLAAVDSIRDKRRCVGATRVCQARVDVRVVFTGADLLIDGRLTRSNLSVDGHTISTIGDDVDPAAEIVDCSGLVISPGFIDLQCNGAVGADITTDPTSIGIVAEALPSFGVTSFLPTVVTSPASSGTQRSRHCGARTVRPRVPTRSACTSRAR